MTKQENKTEEGKDIIESWTSNRITVFLLTSGYTLGMIGGIAIISYYLDQKFETYPTILIIGLIAGFPLTQFVIYKKFKKFAKKELKNG